MEQIRQPRIHSWHCKMLPGKKDATKWLSGHKVVCSSSLSYGQHGEIKTVFAPTEGLQKLGDFGSAICFGPILTNYHDGLHLWRHLGSPHALQPSALTSLDLQRSAAGSSGGVDGWSGPGVPARSEEIRRTYADLPVRWQERRQWPQAWQQTRQVHIPNLGRSLAGGSVHVADMGPISVQSVCGGYLPAITRSEPVVHWLSQIAPPEAKAVTEGDWFPARCFLTCFCTTSCCNLTNLPCCTHRQYR